MVHTSPLIISGGGISGLATALVLAQDGHMAYRALLKRKDARYLRTGRVQLTARFYGDIHHAAGAQRELHKQMLQSGTESAGVAGLKWMYDGIEPSKLFQ